MNIFKFIKSPLAIFVLLSTLFTSNVLSANVDPNGVLRAIDGCNKWRSKARSYGLSTHFSHACDFRFKNHDFRVWHPEISRYGNGHKISIKFDHKKKWRRDDIRNVSFLRLDNGTCTTISDRTKIRGGILNKIDEGGWKGALEQVKSSIYLVYCD